MKILLICGAGASTSLVVKKMNDFIVTTNEQHQIEAIGIHLLDEKIPFYDVFLIGPQIKYALKEIQNKCSPKPVAAIPPRLYAMADGAGVLKLAKELYNEGQE
ncbi:MAG: PTS sugar transporter subunit IIB [Mycoplasmataceae bacterium]|nr:PTS sugar transporter subunit IIB [Mycoplasmataceae bacterium]